VASNEVAKLMLRADLVVASGGGATYERLYLRRPSLIKVVAENQRKPLQYMANIGLFSLYSNRTELEIALRQAFAEEILFGYAKVAVPDPSANHNAIVSVNDKESTQFSLGSSR
jgi:spore coat polysaccharide biosynthesis predicted glycosyltransferase SpsG